MILGLILIAILCMVVVGMAYDTSGDKHVDCNALQGHTQDFEAVRRSEIRRNVDSWGKVK